MGYSTRLFVMCLVLLLIKAVAQFYTKLNCGFLRGIFDELLLKFYCKVTFLSLEKYTDNMHVGSNK